jgi:hypothetical protein
MILALDELGSHPIGKSQWYPYYNTTDDAIYIKTGTDPSVTTDFEVVEYGAAIRDTVRIGATLARVKYAGRDYGTFQDEILAFIKDQFGDDFNDFNASQIAIMIVQYVSFALDTMSWYLDKQSEENFLTTARLRSSVNRFARLLGYKPSQMVNASVDLDLILDQNYGFDITVPKGSKINGPNGLIYELNQDVTFTAAEQSSAVYPYTKTQYLPGQNISAYEGETINESFISDGTANQIFKLTSVPSDKTIAKDSVILKVDGDSWAENDFLNFEQSNQFMIDYAAAPPTIRFGNGAIGNIPETGAEISVLYVAGSGTAGVAAAGTLTTFRDSLTINFTVINISCNNSSASSGSAPEESISSIQASAPKWYATVDRAVSLSDFRILSEKFSSGTYGSVARANAIRLLGVENEVGIQGGLNNINTQTANLSVFLSTVTTKNTAIRTSSNTVKIETASAKSILASIGTKQATIKTDTANATSHIADANSDLDIAIDAASSVPFQEIMAQGDGATKSFYKLLTFQNIVPRSLSIVVEPVVAASDVTGDCETSPGFVEVATAAFFLSGDVGKLIRIGGLKRQILEFVNDKKVRYSGNRMFGTNLIVEKYGDSVYGFDDGAGAISGPGIDTGSTINYASGALTVNFVIAPEGISGEFGKNIYVNFQYELESATTAIDNAKSDLTEANSDITQAETDVDSIDTDTAVISTDMDDIDTLADTINADSVISDTYIGYTALIPANVTTAVQDLEDYLDTVISGECKANIIQVQVLTVDADGFYTAPSNGLLSSLKDNIDGKKLASVTVSTIDGARFLIGVDIEVKVKVKELFAPADILTEVSEQVDIVFKNREFGQKLRLDEFNQAIKANVVTQAGATKYEYINVKITGTRFVDTTVTDTPPSANSDGDLEIEDNQIITKGVNTEIKQIVELTA